MMNEIQVIIKRKWQEADGIVGIELARPSGLPLPAFSAGAHIDIHLPNGLVRQYSLCNSPGEHDRYQIAVLLEPSSRGGSRAVHEFLKEQDLIQISEPKNLFPLVEADTYLLFAGGIGVTPILCMAEHLAATGANFYMYYASRSPERTAFLKRIASAPFADRVIHYFDTDKEVRPFELSKILHQPSNGAHVYVCGPAGYIDFVKNCAYELGWSTQNVHVEFFGAQQQDLSANNEFEVCVASTGESYVVGRDETVAAVLAMHGVKVPTSCEQGVCGTCVTKILEGIPDHRDLYFTDEERKRSDQFTPCCSRAKTRKLVLDL